MFFGSSEGLFERVQSDLAARPPRSVSHVVLDFGLVTGADASATVSLTKLRNHCQKQGTTLVFAAIPPDVRRAFERDGLLGAGAGQPAPFADMSIALAWCEERLLERAGHELGEHGDDPAAFEPWLQQQLGPAVLSLIHI